MLTGANTEQLIYSLILLLIISVLMNLYFANLGLNKKLNKRMLDKNLPSLIKKFLLDQAHKTENAPRHNERKHISKSVVSFRNAYLNIEAKAIDRKIDSPEYWNLINTKLQKLISILLEQKDNKPLAEIEQKIATIKTLISQSPENEKTRAVLDSLDKFHAACLEHNGNPKKVAHYNHKLDQLLKKLSSANYRKLTEKTQIHKEYSESNYKTLDSLRSQVHHSNEAVESLKNIDPDDFDFSVDAFSKNQTHILDSVDKYESNLEKIDKNNRQTSAAIISTANDTELKNYNSDLDELSEQIQRENEQEIERLRDVIKNQKNIIMELEDSISSLEEESSESPPVERSSMEQEKYEQDKAKKEQDIDRLKRCLKEAEICIDTLEGELDDLKGKHKHHKENPKEDPVSAPLTDNNLSNLENTITELRDEISEAKNIQDLHKSIMEFVTDCLDASSIEDISFSIYQTLEDIGWVSSLIVKGATRTMEIDPNGLLKDREKTLIKNMQIGEIDTKKSGKEIRFHYLNLSGKVIGKSGGPIQTEQQAAIINLIKTTDKIIGRMNAIQGLRDQKKVMQESSNTVKQLAQEVDLTIEKINKRTKESISNSFGQVQDLARSKGLKASQIASFRNLEQQTLHEIDADKTLRLKIKKQFLVVLKNLDN